MRTLLLDWLILLDTLFTVAGISRNHAVARRTPILLIGVLAYTRRDRLRTNRNALIVVVDIVIVAVSETPTNGQQLFKIVRSSLDATYHS